MSHVGPDEAMELSEPAVDHGFIDPDELAGHVISGERDTETHDESASAVEVTSSADAPSASDPEAAKTSAPDDPAVD
jgi:hypothetical protein